MNICSDRKEECIAGIDGVVCLHSKPHHKFNECSHTRFYCGQYPDKQHRCRKFKPERSNFTCVKNFDTFIVTGIILDRELLRLMIKYGTTARGHSDTCSRAALPAWLFETFVAGMI